MIAQARLVIRSSMTHRGVLRSLIQRRAIVHPSTLDLEPA